MATILVTLLWFVSGAAAFLASSALESHEKPDHKIAAGLLAVSWACLAGLIATVNLQ